ncbi:MAG TPA: organic solvent tolerance protein OstA [Pirellulaceae bacterium]|nr:organic solvent tolerance protein OstA [Pirellulaceae bacterium]
MNHEFSDDGVGCKYSVLSTQYSVLIAFARCAVLRQIPLIVILGVLTIGFPLVVCGEVEFPAGSKSAPVVVRADGATHWTQGEYEVWALRGHCQIEQGDMVAVGDEGVLWVDRADTFSGRPSKAIAYLEGSVQVNYGRKGDPHALTGQRAQSVKDKTWIGRFETTGGIELAVPVTGNDSANRPPIVQRSLAAWSPRSQPPESGDPRTPNPESPSPDARFQRAQFTREEIAPPVGTPLSPLGNRVRVFPRGGGRWNLRTFVDEARNERIALINSGVQIVVDGVDELGTVSVETDRIVFWLPNSNLADAALSQNLQSGEGPLEFYLEGNIVFRQGDRVIYADRMYYNVRQEYGVVLNAEMLTPVPEYQGLLRLKAEVLQQVNRQRFEAYGAALTSSRIGVPRYWFQTQSVAIDDLQTPLIDPFTNLPLVDPATGEPQVDHQLMATSRNNFVYLGGVPVFYWPTIATDLTKPTYYFDGIKIKNDSVFGTQTLLDWDLHQLLGMENVPPGTEWTLSTDFLSERGPALGTNYKYAGDTLWGVPGPYHGFIDAWGIKDDGLDNLGRGRMDIVPSTTLRGRVLARHQQALPNDWFLMAEAGVISDFNFLEQYYELEWDTFKDETTGVYLNRLANSHSFSFAGDVRLNDFFTQTEGGRGDWFTLGQSLLFDRLTWHQHTHAGYLHMGPANPPTDPQDLAVWSPLAWEADRQGLRAATRHELDLPLQAGPTKVVPYVIGEFAYWGDDLSGDAISRTYLQPGVKASLPIWSANPQVSSELLNLNGLAHKLTFEADAFYAQASQDLGNFPLFDPLDDDSTEAFRRRMAVNTFGQPLGTFVPMRFDERQYALRSNLQGSVSSPVEIVDDLTEIRLGLNQRWQTKRGLPGQERIIDWVVLDVSAVLFPQPDRDNFGEEIGLVDYAFQWHVGDRFTLLSDGFYDIFDDGLQQTTVGGILNRPQFGSLYVGYRSTEGPFSSSLLSGSLSYRMSEKWIATAGASWDLGPTGNIGQNVAVTRIGESFLLRFGVNFDVSRNNLGVNFLLEPRFLSSSRLGRVGGVQIPPAGAMGLE